MERKLSTKKHVFESIFFSDGHLYLDNTFGIRFNKPIRFIFKDNIAFPNPSLLIVEYSFGAIFEREVEADYEESEPIHWQMVNFRIGLIKRSLKIETTFVPSNPEVDESTFHSNLISFFPDQINISSHVDVGSIKKLKWLDYPLDEEHLNTQIVQIKNDDNPPWFNGIGARVFEILADRNLLNVGEDECSNNYFEPSHYLKSSIKAKANDFIRQIYGSTTHEPIFITKWIYDTISSDCAMCNNPFYCYNGDGTELVNPVGYEPDIPHHTFCETCKGKFIYLTKFIF